MAIWIEDPKERHALGLRSKRETIKCPVCGSDGECQRNGDWRCDASRTEQFGALAVHWLTCGARGVTVNGDLVATSWPYHEETDTV